MDDSDDRSRSPALPVPAGNSSTALDAHGYNPADYDWVPVRRRPRKDGWSLERQRDFIGALADCGIVEQAAREVGMSPRSAYRLRREPGGERFAAAWTAALHQAALTLEDLAFDRAFNGSDEPIFDREGRRMGRRFRQSDRLIMFLLRSHLPERYGQRDGVARSVGTPDIALTPPVRQAIEALAPAAPADPAALMAPDDLADALRIADVIPGQLPRWLRDRDGRADEYAEPVAADLLDPILTAALAEADREAAQSLDEAMAAYWEEDEEDEDDTEPSARL